MKRIALDGRLLSAAKFVRQGAVFADVGTDHAHLPVFLLKSGRICRAVLSDINEGPLASARENVEREGLSSLVTLILTDGAVSLEGMGITDVAVCGMGGELISKIVSDAEWLKDSSVRLILQPMTRQAHLRRTLASLGFKIFGESYSHSSGKYYVTIAAEYTAEPYELTPEIAEFGEEFVDYDNKASQIRYLELKLAALTKKIRGMREAGMSTETCEELEGALRRRITLILGAEQ